MALRARRILVTGGGGFIGSHLVERLAPGNRVTTLDSGRRDALKLVALDPAWGVRVVAGDVLDVTTVRSLVADADVVFHLAAVAGVSDYQKMPVETMTVNMIGTANVLAAAADAGVERVVNFATSEMYGPRAAHAREDDFLMPGPPGQLRWTYAVSKLAGEHLAIAYHRQRGLPVTSLRPFNVYGPRQVGEGAVQIFIAQAVEGRSVTVQGDGAQVRAWCYVDDMVEAALAAAAHPAAVGRCFNIGAPAAAVTTLELARKVIALTGSPSKVEHVAAPAQVVETRVPVVESAREVLGWQPRTDLDTGLRRTIEWYRRCRG
jgi:UDP-glucose 4-epimerase